MSDEIEKFMAAHQRLVTAQEALDDADVAAKPFSDQVLNCLFEERNGALWAVISAKAPTLDEILLKAKWLRRIDGDEREIGSPYCDERTQRMIASIIKDCQSALISN